MEARALVEKFHQMDEALLKRVFGGADYLLKPNSKESTVDPLGATFVLASHLSSDALWNRTEWIAVDSASHANLNRDVNKSLEWEGPPPPPIGIHDYRPDETPDIQGVSMLPLTFLVALGLSTLQLVVLFFLHMC